MSRLLILACLASLAGALPAQVRGPASLPPRVGAMGPASVPMPGPRLPSSPASAPADARGIPPAAASAMDAVPGNPMAGRVTDRIIARAHPVDVRRLRIRQLVHALPERIDLDPAGEPILRGEFLVVDPGADALRAVAAAGFERIGTEATSDGLGFDVVILRDTRQRSAAEAMAALRRAAPSTEFAFQHVYLESASGPVAAIPRTRGAASGALRVGLVDSGVDGAAAGLSGMRIERHGCDGRAVPANHGTIVASRLAGGATGTLYAADLWCGDRVGRATAGLIEALAWMGRSRVGVINVSLVGPHNPALAKAIQALQARGHVVVAAVGNDGPAAPALYPAAYPGVIGVGAVDEKLRPLPESASGPQVDYVAPGVVKAGRRPLRGTSFAAPVVARLAAQAMPTPDRQAAVRAEALLRQAAVDIGKRRGDPRVGAGLIANAR